MDVVGSCFWVMDDCRGHDLYDCSYVDLWTSEQGQVVKKAGSLGQSPLNWWTFWFRLNCTMQVDAVSAILRPCIDFNQVTVMPAIFSRTALLAFCCWRPGCWGCALTHTGCPITTRLHGCCLALWSWHCLAVCLLCMTVTVDWTSGLYRDSSHFKNDLVLSRLHKQRDS